MPIDPRERRAAVSGTPVRPRIDRLTEPERRVDGGVKVSGQAKYSADFAMEGMLWAAFLTAPVAHARIVSIDTAAARAIPGVHAVLTGADIGERYLGRVLFDWPVLAFDKVRFIGDHVAAVAAETREIAQAAVAAIEVRYAELPPIFDTEASITSDALIHEHPERYAYSKGRRSPVPHGNMQGYDVTVHGDVDAGFAQAVRVFEHTFTTPRYFAGYIEPRATLVWIDGAGVVHVVTTNKAPFELREQLAISTGLPRESFVVEPSFIGGDFGSKGFSVEEFQCYELARATGRPVKHVRAYADDMRATVVRHASKITMRSGVNADGRFVALDARMLYDGGAYAAGKPIPALIPGAKAKTPYVFRNSRVERICAYTNTIPSGQVRDPAGIPLVFAIESHVDMVARELGIDPLEFRRRNAIGEGDVDLDGTVYVEPQAHAVLDALQAAVDWGKPLQPGHGRGISLASRHVGGGKTSLNLALTRAGTVEIRIGATEQGGGVLTVAGRVAAAVLDVDPASIDVARGSTASVPPDPGTGASRATHIVGRAAEDAARQLRAKLEAAGYPQVGWERAAAALVQDGPVEIVGSYDENHKPGEAETHNFCAYCIEVSVDRETGALRIHDVVFVSDAGTVINPVAHRGQIDGGFAFGLGHALTEELHVEDGKILNLSLAEYKLPTQMDMPPFRVVMLHDALGPGPFGAKMAGELSISSVPATIANAIADACGARLTALPLTAERLFDALNGGP
jgi:CO/xanthine dehydrogenase Mo-binding subunit